MTNDSGFSFTMEKNENTIEIDNRWVVPYSPLLCKACNAQINVEFCNSVKSIKYACKYIIKGSDQAVFSIESRNEVEAFQN